MERSIVHIADGQVSLFDFGGQLEYTVTHQFFLSNKVIYILPVFNIIVFIDIIQLVVYIVCYDLSSSPNEQRRQIDSWLSYLNSLLCHNATNQGNSTAQPEWKVIIAGTRSDIKDAKTVNLKSTDAFRNKFPSLPLHESVFHFNTVQDLKSVKLLFNEIVNQCDQIMNAHSIYLPTHFTMLKKDISTCSSPSCSIIDLSSLPSQWQENPQLTNQALQHLHSIGEIVMFGKHKICTNPQVISNLMAKFICPVEVRTKMLVGDDTPVSLLKKSDMQTILQVRDSRYSVFPYNSS